MQTASRLQQSHTPTDVGDSGGPSGLLLGVFDTLDRAGIPYCVLHGYRDYPRRIQSDVDCLIGPNINSAQLLALLRETGSRFGAEVVLCRNYYFILAGRESDGSPYFLTLDMSVDYEVDGLAYYAGTEVLENCRRHDRFWVPVPCFEFGGYLVRTIAKGCLDEERARRLSSLFREDPTGCEQHVARFWRTRGRALIVSAARSGNWTPVRQQLDKLRGELRWGAAVRHPARFAANRFHGFIGRVRRLVRPEGIDVVLLGPDGAGKSSVIEALGPRLAPVFARSTCWGFAPPVLGRLRYRGVRRTDQPHALAPRSLPVSLARAGYWFVYYTFGYLKRHLALARSTLVLNDRHFVDILVDRRRYRYGGPLWVLQLIWHVMPKPDLVILLDAPAEVLQARKQEVPFEETASQRRAYLSLMQTVESGHVANAAQPKARVADDVSGIILRHLALRLARRFGLEQNVDVENSRSRSAQVSAVMPITNEK